MYFFHKVHKVKYLHLMIFLVCWASLYSITSIVPLSLCSSFSLFYLSLFPVLRSVTAAACYAFAGLFDLVLAVYSRAEAVWIMKLWWLCHWRFYWRNFSIDKSKSCKSAILWNIDTHLGRQTGQIVLHKCRQFFFFFPTISGRWGEKCIITHAYTIILFTFHSETHTHTHYIHTTYTHTRANTHTHTGPH